MNDFLLWIGTSPLPLLTIGLCAGFVAGIQVSTSQARKEEREAMRVLRIVVEQARRAQRQQEAEEGE